MFWQRVTIQDVTESQTGTGHVRLTPDVLLEDVEARILPLVVDERAERWATPEEDAYEIQLRHAHVGIRPRMRVVVDEAIYDIRRILQPPPFADPVTILQCVKVTP